MRSLVDQRGRKRLSGHVGAADCEVAFRLGLYPPDRVGVELSLDPG